MTTTQTTNTRRAPASGASGSDSTRYLCAAMQLNSRLARATIDKVVEDPHRAAASSPAVDLATVLKYALAAQRRQLVRDSVLAVLAVLALTALANASAPAFWLMLLAAWATVLIETVYTYHEVIIPRLRRDAFVPAQAPDPPSPEHRARLADIADRDRGNVTVFAGYAPTAGYGELVNTWSLSLNVARPEEGKEITPFAVHEVYEHIGGKVAELDLPGVLVEDRLFVNGLDLQHGVDPQVEQMILPDPLKAPVARVDGAALRRLRDDPHGRARPYLTFCVTGWDGELVTTIFLRFVLLPKRDVLFMESTVLVLPPTDERYTKVDRLPVTPTPRWILGLARETAFRSIGLLVISIPMVIAHLLGPVRGWREESRRKRMILQQRAFNYGAEPNPREKTNDGRYHRYFQKLDSDLYLKTVEHRVMDALVEFLSEHNVDVSELVERQTTILNSGIYIGGQAQVNAQSMAAGLGASARVFADQAAARFGGGRGGGQAGGAGPAAPGGRTGGRR
jgi:hypothetical protein